MNETRFNLEQMRALADWAQAHFDWYENIADGGLVRRMTAYLLAACAALELAEHDWQIQHTKWVRADEQLNMARRELEQARADADFFRRTVGAAKSMSKKDFLELIRVDPDLTQAQKDYWLEIG